LRQSLSGSLHRLPTKAHRRGRRGPSVARLIVAPRWRGIVERYAAPLKPSPVGLLGFKRATIFTRHVAPLLESFLIFLGLIISASGTAVRMTSRNPPGEAHNTGQSIARPPNNYGRLLGHFGPIESPSTLHT
jgi:hypothetical protein